ncbi:hypothetical protein [Agarilytica rhodophyticola]|uniref:hypothetical protein n=1 Tax=Agarilytica rhodophyticola TaxID=1737490 RepID=UPI000B3410CF|nr:hypothetical protein [Agarilytica rhodophyticola]
MFGIRQHQRVHQQSNLNTDSVKKNRNPFRAKSSRPQFSSSADSLLRKEAKAAWKNSDARTQSHKEHGIAKMTLVAGGVLTATTLVGGVLAPALGPAIAIANRREDREQFIGEYLRQKQQ